MNQLPKYSIASTMNTSVEKTSIVKSKFSCNTGQTIQKYVDVNKMHSHHPLSTKHASNKQFPNKVEIFSFSGDEETSTGKISIAN